jgi:acetyl coenzyme A synthetase (ADP forming)-like protein
MTIDTAITPPGYPADWERDILLKTGSTAHLRPIKPSDATGLEALVSRMSRESVYHRFFRAKKQLDPEELEYFTVLDYDTRMAFVVERDGVIIGVGRYDRDSSSDPVAEVAFAVADADQGQGIGTRLLDYLTAYARPRGITAFRAYVLADNHAMVRVFRGAGFRMQRELDDGVYTVEFPTEESDETVAAAEEHEKRATAASITPLFYPHSIAVIGASRNPASIGGRLMANLLSGDFSGPVYPVNPKAGVVHSMLAYQSVLDCPTGVDLAFIVVPSDHVLQAVEECAEKGVKGLVVISAGFGETGEEGRELEDRLLALVRDNSMRMVGPNCMGIVNTDPAIRMDGQFGPVHPRRGNVAMSSQSGALGIAILDYATKLNIGISTFVSVGNKADVSGNDLLTYWEDDPATDVIVLYLESFGSPRRFARIARRIGQRKPIVAVKSGRTAAGARAASSHTGSLASLDIAVNALFDQAGVIRTDTLAELFDVTALLANQPLPQGRRVGIITNAGGPAILAVDALESEGLEVVQFSQALQDRLMGHLSAEAAVANPVDMIASAGPDQYAECIEAVMASGEVDALVTIFTPASPVGAEETAAAIARAAATTTGSTTFLAVYMSSSGAPADLAGPDSRVPVYVFPEQAARALSRAVQYADWKSTPTGRMVTFEDIDSETARAVMDRAVADLDGKQAWMDADDVDALLGAYGIKLPMAGVARTEDDAVEIASRFQGSAVVKVIAESAVHKSDVGGVVLGVRGEADVRAAFRQVTTAVPDAEGALVQEFVQGGHEVLIGMTQDPNFGPLIVFGLGGVFVELIGDVAFRIHPLTDLDAEAMIKRVKSAKLLEGYRGGDPGDIEAVKETLLRVSALIEDFPEITEMDMNPVKVAKPGDGVTVVDARIRIAEAHRSWVPDPGLRTAAAHPHA